MRHGAGLTVWRRSPWPGSILLCRPLGRPLGRPLSRPLRRPLRRPLSRRRGRPFPSFCFFS
jgi:hypothetical protein